MSGDVARGYASERDLDFADAIGLIGQSGVVLRSETQPEDLRGAIGAEGLAARPISEVLCALAVGERFSAEFAPGALEEGAWSADLLVLRLSKEARIDPAAALRALAALSGQSARLGGAVQTIQPGDGFEYLKFDLDGAKREIVIDATAGFDPAAELARLARVLEKGRKAFYLHRRGALMIVLHLHEESAEALNAAEPSLLETLTSFEVAFSMLRLSRKTLRRLPFPLFLLSATLWLYLETTNAKLLGYQAGVFGVAALLMGAFGLAALLRQRP